MTLNELIKSGSVLEADGMIEIYDINSGQVIARYEGLRIHKALEFLKNSPNPDCEYCLGTGEYYWHSEDCINDNCVLAAGYDDCNGLIIKCHCSLLDKIEVEGE